MMCAHGEEVLLRVPIPAHLSHTGQMRWDWKDGRVLRIISPADSIAMIESE